MLEESLEVLLGTRMTGNDPPKILILVRMQHILVESGIIAQAAHLDGIRSRDDGIGVCIVEPERTVVDTEFQALGLQHGHDILELHFRRVLVFPYMTVASHVTVITAHGREAIGNEHIIAVGLEILRHVIAGFLPVVHGKDVWERAFLLLLAQ